jgi:uncharacterized tellurite resistance protein B-like protein
MRRTVDESRGRRKTNFLKCAYDAAVDFEQRAKVCKLIEAVISADGVVVAEEREFLDQVLRKFKISEEDVDGAALSADLGRTTATLREMPSDMATRVMALLVDAAIVDGRVEPQERALLLASAAALGIEATALEERIARRLQFAS